MSQALHIPLERLKEQTEELMSEPFKTILAELKAAAEKIETISKELISLANAKAGSLDVFKRLMLDLEENTRAILELEMRAVSAPDLTASQRYHLRQVYAPSGGINGLNNIFGRDDGEGVENNTPLHLALKSGNFPVAEFLCQEKYVILLKRANCNGIKPLDIALAHNHLRIVQLSCELSPELLDEVDDNHDTVLHRWVYGSKALEEIEAFAGDDDVHCNGLAVLKYLVEQRSQSLIQRNKKGKTPLHLMMEHVNRQMKFDMVEYICQHHTEVLGLTDDEGRTALSSALHHDAKQAAMRFDDAQPDSDDLKAYDLLIRNMTPEQISLTDRDRKTALDYASEQGGHAVVNMLIDRVQQAVPDNDDNAGEESMKDGDDSYERLAMSDEEMTTKRASEILKLDGKAKEEKLTSDDISNQAEKGRLIKSKQTSLAYGRQPMGIFSSSNRLATPEQSQSDTSHDNQASINNTHKEIVSKTAGP